jgi:hypothetical protein
MNDNWEKNSDFIMDNIPIPSNTGYQAYANPISGAESNLVSQDAPHPAWSNPSHHSAPTAPLSYTPKTATNYPMATVIGEPAKGTILNEEDQMREAMKLSLVEYDSSASVNAPSAPVISTSYTGLSKEDEEMARAIEQSIAAANPKTEDEPLNPHLRKREPGMGVGLKNIGNTCYVNSLLQTYFSIPELREAILKWDYTPWMNDQAAAESKGGGVALVAALQQLFSEMMLSNRK